MPLSAGAAHKVIRRMIRSLDLLTCSAVQPLPTRVGERKRS